MESKTNIPYVLVTGSSSGIGKEIAIQLSNEYNVILHGRDSDKLEQVKSQCNKNFSQIIWQNDLNDIQNVEASLLNFITGHNISVIKFVHSAGFMKLAPLKTTTIDVFYRSFNINIIAAGLICKLLIQKKVNENNLDSIVFISSNISDRGAKALSAYGASKGALDTFMRCLAMELAPKVRCNSVLPGAVLTDMTQSIFENEEVKNRMEASYPLGLGNPNSVYQVVKFLLSEEANWITGQQITVDGGKSINITG